MKKQTQSSSTNINQKGGDKYRRNEIQIQFDLISQLMDDDAIFLSQVPHFEEDGRVHCYESDDVDSKKK